MACSSTTPLIRKNGKFLMKVNIKYKKAPSSYKSKEIRSKCRHYPCLVLFRSYKYTCNYCGASYISPGDSDANHKKSCPSRCRIE